MSTSSGSTRQEPIEPMDRDTDAVELRVRARPTHLRLVRLTACGFASDLGFDLDSLENLRLAVNELCAVLIDGVDPSSSLRVRYTRTPQGRLRVDGTLQGAFAPVEIHPVARELLGIVAKDYDVSMVDSGRVFWLEADAGDR